jgi:hypothetical protein
MAKMTEAEAWTLDEEWTRNPPDCEGGNGGGFFARHGADVWVRDTATSRILSAKAASLGKTPSAFVSELIRKNAAVAAASL